MNRKRGAPVLIELISRPSGPSVGGSPVAPYPAENNGRGGSPVSDPATWGSAASRQAPNRSDWRLPAMLIGAGVIVVVAASIIGFQLGQKKEKKEWAENNAAGPAATAKPNGTGGIVPGPGVTDPLNGGGVVDPNAAAGGGVVRPGPVSPAPQAPAAALPLQDGWNYLVVGTSMRRAAAETAARYLADSGIACQLLPMDGEGLERGGGGANNALWQVWVLQGVPGGAEYSKHLSERRALESKVQLLGRTWKAQDRKAPTDFAELFWKKYKSG